MGGGYNSVVRKPYASCESHFTSKHRKSKYPHHFVNSPLPPLHLFEPMNIPQLYQLFRLHPHITTDTRKIVPESIFFALHGQRFNGNDYAVKALQEGCSYAVIDQNISHSPEYASRLIHVEDTLTTLQELAHHHRQQFQGPVIQITGTNGKTTTKELIAAVLSQRWHVHYTQGNLNNHIGVPLTLLALPLHQANTIAVIETGANHPGEIDALSRITNPDCGLITNVGTAHLEGFGNLQGVIQTKTELYRYLQQKTDTYIFLHADNTHLTPHAKPLPCITYGSVGHHYDVEGEIINLDPFLTFRWQQPGQPSHQVRTQLIGDYNLPNMLAAIAVGLHFCITPQQINHALTTYTPNLGRSELRQTPTNTLIIDAYNANLTSMQAALQNFQNIQSHNPIAILGDMKELGAESTRAHQQILQQALNLNLTSLYLVGQEFTAVAAQTTAQCFPDVETLITHLKTHPITGATILIKGSNSTRLHHLPQFL